MQNNIFHIILNLPQVLTKLPLSFFSNLLTQRLLTRIETDRQSHLSFTVFLSRIDGQIRLVRLQADNFRLFLRQQTDK